jgi:hypothetical protein
MKRLGTDKAKDNDIALRIAVVVAIGVLAWIALEMGIAYLTLD